MGGPDLLVMTTSDEVAGRERARRCGCTEGRERGWGIALREEGRFKSRPWMFFTRPTSGRCLLTDCGEGRAPKP